MPLNCAFSGHRIIKGEHEGRIRDLLARAIAYAYEQGCRSFFSGGAIGFDTLCAMEVIKFRRTHGDARLVMLLPCVNQAAKWSDYQKQDYSYILSEADETVYVSEEYTPDCMRKRNALLAERADILVCYLGSRSSGTGQTVAMASRLGKTVYNLYANLEKNP